jgi:uncharacterized RDD family membrane protein YckC
MTAYTPAPLFRRLIALIYESLLLAAVTTVALVICSPIVQLTHNNGAIVSTIVGIVLLSFWWLYYKYSIGRKGQTLAMTVWKIKLINAHGQKPQTKQLFMRYLWAVIFLMMIPSVMYLISTSRGIPPKTAAGAALIWWILPWGYAFFNPERQFLYDLLAGTRLVLDPEYMAAKNKKNTKK